MLWARLTWQAADPASIVEGLGRWLGLVAVPDAAADGALVLRLGETELEVRPWQQEGTDDEPHPGGRLMFEPHRGPQPVGGADGTSASLVGVAWSTVELDRAETELGNWLTGSDPAAALADGADAHLGARTRVRRTHALPGGRIVLAEPSTEGRLAASLARDGEGPCALYVAPAGGLEAWLGEARGNGLSTRAARRLDGPFGASVLLPPGSPAGPFILVVEGPPGGSSGPVPGTIDA